MKYLLIVVALIAALVGVLLYVPGEDGKPLLSVDQVKATIESTGAQLPDAMQGQEDDADVLPTMFRWRDAKGNWQYGDRPPPGVSAEPVEEKGVQNIADFEKQQQEQDKP